MPINKPQRYILDETPRSLGQMSKTPITINVYDLLPPGILSSILWAIGLPLLHTGIVVHNREYSYGAIVLPSFESTSRRSGIFWTTPALEPLGATFRCELLLGFTYLSPHELDRLVADVSQRFPGHEYNLLGNNCNHFTNHMAKLLTRRELPGWVNRATKVGIALPCLVPRDWISPPELDDSDERPEALQEDVDERSSMLGSERRLLRNWFVAQGERVRDTDGRNLPASELAPPDALV